MKSPFEVRTSPIDGQGAFATQRIPAGTPVVEYTGELLTEGEVDARYANDSTPRGHTLLFQVSDGFYVDAALAGNEARFINHSCDPNCEVEIDGFRILIVACRDVEPGEELTYDYNLELEEDYLPSWRQVYECRCGAAGCRGTMLDPGCLPPG